MLAGPGPAEYIRRGIGGRQGRRQGWELLENTGIRYSRRVTESIEALERRIQALRAEVRRAAVSGDRVHARAVRAELREAEHAWDVALADLEEQSPPAGRHPRGAVAAAGAPPPRRGAVRPAPNPLAAPPPP